MAMTHYSLIPTTLDAGIYLLTTQYETTVNTSSHLNLLPCAIINQSVFTQSHALFCCDLVGVEWSGGEAAGGTDIYMRCRVKG